MTLTEDDLLKLCDEVAVSGARDAALEEAAAVCDALAEELEILHLYIAAREPRTLAGRIRALKSASPTPDAKE